MYDKICPNNEYIFFKKSVDILTNRDGVIISIERLNL